MGFYYGSSKPPDDDPPPGSWRETIEIIWVVFKTLALPLGLLFGVIFGVILVIWAFIVNAWIGLALLLLGVGALVARGIWEAKHPPDLS
jgi:hypothetical protein